MPADTPAVGSPRAGLRERKKARTRAEIRAQGLRLFREQGYHQTSTEQIAAAADISPATFFRYFATKERVVLSDDLEPTMLAALAAQPSDLPVLTALYLAIRDDCATGTPGRAGAPRAHRRRTRTSGAQRDDIRRTVQLLAGAVAERLGRRPGDFEIRVFTGALTGAVLAALDHDRWSAQGVDV
jgi:AcrR family transcriptional regulator